MTIRKTPLVIGQFYHIFTRSIADYKVFKSHNDFVRMIDTMIYYRSKNTPQKFSRFYSKKNKKNFTLELEEGEKFVKIIAYCLMPTHIHLLLQQIEENGISNFMERVLKSYSKYYNTKYKRKGPLWESRFKNVIIKNDEQLLHLTRYIHLNPVTAYIVKKPEEWLFSSYREYIDDSSKKICEFEGFIEIKSEKYKSFVEERIDYQRELAKIKHLLLE